MMAPYKIPVTLPEEIFVKLKRISNDMNVSVNDLLVMILDGAIRV